MFYVFFTIILVIYDRCDSGIITRYTFKLVLKIYNIIPQCPYTVHSEENFQPETRRFIGTIRSERSQKLLVKDA